MGRQFWPRLYAVKYIGLGLAGFALPTHKPYEVTIRIVFIVFGVLLLTALGRPSRTHRLLSVMVVVLAFWILFAGVIIVDMWPDVYARVLVATLPFWVGWWIGHFHVMHEVRRGGG